jgi:hypothetical protein
LASIAELAKDQIEWLLIKRLKYTLRAGYGCTARMHVIRLLAPPLAGEAGDDITVL